MIAVQACEIQLLLSVFLLPQFSQYDEPAEIDIWTMRPGRASSNENSLSVSFMWY